MRFIYFILIRCMSFTMLTIHELTTVHLGITQSIAAHTLT